MVFGFWFLVFGFWFLVFGFEFADALGVGSRPDRRVTSFCFAKKK